MSTQGKGGAAPNTAGLGVSRGSLARAEDVDPSASVAARRVEVLVASSRAWIDQAKEPPHGRPGLARTTHGEVASGRICDPGTRSSSVGGGAEVQDEGRVVVSPRRSRSRTMGDRSGSTR